VLAVEAQGPPEFLVKQELLKAEQARAAMQVRVRGSGTGGRPAWRRSRRWRKRNWPSDGKGWSFWKSSGDGSVQVSDVVAGLAGAGGVTGHSEAVVDRGEAEAGAASRPKMRFTRYWAR